MRCLVAVSGGVDSVVLLDTLVRAGGHELIVAHFDHGIRSDSAADARFVAALAKKYDLPFVLAREELGSGASEELARDRRYAFLRQEAHARAATIVTAHHADDVTETIAINLLRGTGWRGLAVLDAPDIFRPLLRQTKADIREYALAHRLEWVEDATNATTGYLRNRVRQVITMRLPAENRQRLLDVWRQQRTLKTPIDETTETFVQPSGEYSRYFFSSIEPVVACELLRTVVRTATGASPTRPQAERALLAIKTARHRGLHEVSGQARLRFTTRTFIVETP